MASTMEPTATLWANIVALIQCAICSIGLLLNGFLAFILATNKDLRSSGCCALLILAMALYDCANEFSLIFIPTFLTVAGQTLPLRTCFFLQFYGPYALLNSGMTMFLISADRLFAAALPMQYKSFTIDHRGKYLAVLILCPPLLLAPNLYQNYLYAMGDPEKRVFCMPTDFMGPATIQRELYGALLLITGTLSIYTAIWALIKFKVVKKMQHKGDRLLFKSLFVLIAIIFFCGMPIPIVGNFVLSRLPITPDAQNVLYRALLQLNKIGQAANAPVLYVCSGEYRAAMRKGLGRIWCRRKSASGGTKAPMTLNLNKTSSFNGNQPNK